MADEELGTGSVTITLDSDAAEGETERLGDRLERILDRASRRGAAAIQRNIRNGLRAISGVTVDVTAQLDTSAVQAQLDGLRGATVDVVARLDTSAVQAQLDSLSGVTVDVMARLDAASAEAAADRLGDRVERTLARSARDAGLRMQREINAAVRRITPVRVRVEADLRAFGHSIDTLQNFDPIPLPVSPDIDRARFEAAIQTVLDGLEVSVRVVPDLDGFDAAIRAHNAPTVTVDVNADVDRGLSRAVGRIGSALGGLGAAAGSAVRIGAVGIAAASAAQGVAALTAALAPAAGALAALPAVIGGGIAAMAALKLATAGVGDALKAAASGDAEKLADALEKLSPSAREAVSAFAALQPRLKALQQSVQEAFFTRFSDQVKGAVTNLLPLQSALGGISAQFGRAASEGLKFAATKDALTPLRGILAGTHAALSGLAPATQPVLKGFLDVASAVSTAFGQRVGTALRDTLTQFGTFLSVSAASGQAVAWVDGAVTVFKQLGTIVSNVGSVISGVFAAANDVGGGLLNNLVQITGAMEAFVESARGQSAISGIFTALSAVAAQLVPILGAVVETLGAIAPAIAPLFTTIGPAIAGLISALGPALANIAPGLQALVGGLTGGLAAISDSGAFEAIGAAIGSIATAVAPLLPVLGELIGQLTAALAPALTAVASALTPVIQAIASAFMPVIQPLTGAVRTLVTALTPLVTVIGTTLASVIQAVAPLLATLAGVVAQVATALSPLIGQITDALVPIFQQLTPIISAVVAALIPLVEGIVAGLLPVLPPLIDAFLAVVSAVTPLLPVVGELAVAVASLATALLPVITPIVQFAAEVLKWLTLSAVVPVIEGIVKVLTEVITTVTQIITDIANFVTSVVGFFSNLNSRVTSIVRGLIALVTNLFGGLPGKVIGVVSGLVASLAGVFNRARDAVLSAVVNLVGRAVGLIRELPGKAKAALGNLGSLLVSAGQDLIRGLINGVASMAGAIADKAKSVVSGAVSAAKSALGISSPSKVFLAIGKDTGRGFINGLTGSEDGIRRAADRMAKSITDAFKGRNTRIDDVLVSRLRTTERQLIRLADRRDAIAERIKKANEFAAQTAQSALQSFSLQSLAENGGGVQGLTDGIEAAIKKVQGFNRQVAALAKRGLRKDLLSQLIGLGPDQGAGLASTLSKASGAQIKDLNEAQRQLEAASKKLGRDSADALFDSGVNAGRGFLRGLEDQRKQIERVMTDIARSLARRIRRELGIKSPSTVLRKIGMQTMDGLRLGVDDQVPSVARSALRAASAIADPFGAGVSAPRIGGRFGAAGTSTGGAAAGGAVTNSTTSTARTVTINQTINEVGNAEATAQRILNRLAASGVGL